MKSLKEQGFVAIANDVFDVVASLELAKEICDELNDSPDANVWVKRSTRKSDGVTVECVYRQDTGRVWIHQNGHSLRGDADTSGDYIAINVDGGRYYLNSDGQQICCYANCYRLVGALDDEGHPSCAGCAARSFRWVEYVDPDGLLADPAMAKAYIGGMDNLGYSVEATLPPEGSAVGTYYRSSGGDIITARGLDALEAYETDSTRIYNALCQHSGDFSEGAWM